MLRNTCLLLTSLSDSSGLSTNVLVCGKVSTRDSKPDISHFLSPVSVYPFSMKTVTANESVLLTCLFPAKRKTLNTHTQQQRKFISHLVSSLPHLSLAGFDPAVEDGWQNWCQEIKMIPWLLYCSGQACTCAYCLIQISSSAPER